MDTLTLDLEEVAAAPPKFARFVRQRRRAAGVAASEPTTWAAHVESDAPDTADRLMVGIGRSPGDVLWSAKLYADARYAARRGVGRWLLDSDPVAEGGGGSTWLVVTAVYDPEAP